MLWPDISILSGFYDLVTDLAGALNIMSAQLTKLLAFSTFENLCASLDVMQQTHMT